MGEHNKDRDDVAEPARPPLSTTQAREMTAGLREAMDDVRRTVAVLAARVWLLLGHSSWESYCDAESSASAAPRRTGSSTSPAPWPRVAAG
ncbi:hypothetical protein ACFWPV_25780 [Streptomyces uncialis]|uniref:hypothetical protein n=1 Tax=Streptomyces uncialis TaxID=1048205 RepID=UPI0036680F44